MLQFPALMRQWPSPPLIPASTLLPVPATSHEDELLLAMAESDFEDKLNEIRKTNSNMVIIGKPAGEVKEEEDAEAEDDDADNVEDSDGDDFDQETG